MGLKNELIVLYSSEEFEGKSVSKLLKILNSNTMMKSSFPQITLLASLMYTIPVSIAPVERSFSALKRIKTMLEILPGKRDFLV